jgi:flagellar hook-associated protein 2
LNLLAADPTKDVTLTVANDTGKVKTAIEDFVNSYNDLVSYVDERDDIDPNTGTAGILLGSRPAAEILNKLSNDLASPVTALGGALNRLSAVGVRFNDKGRLELDASKLDKALNGQVPGATYADLAKLFTLSGSSSAGGVKFILGSTKTKADGAAIQVDVTQAARQANVTATNMMAGSVTITAGNNTFALNVNGRPATIVTLSAGTYTQLQLAQELQSKINADPILAGNRVSVVVEGGRLRVTTDTYGSASSITGIGGTAAADLGFTGAETGRGQDVVGKFIVNGVEETATGIGQLLGGASGNANTDGLQVLVSLTDSQVQAGPDATITVTRGAAARLDQAISSMLDPINGRLKTFDKSLQRQVDDNNKQITRVRERMDDRQQALIQQFARMEAAVSRLRSAGDTLAAQINQSTANSR